jgi:hypothetical protein
MKDFIPASEVKLGQVFEFDRTYYKRVSFRGETRQVAKDSELYCIVAVEWGRWDNVILLHEENHVELLECPQLITTEDMRTGDVVCMAHCLHDSLMQMVVGKIDGNTIQMHRPHVKADSNGTPWLALESFPDHRSDSHHWYLLRRTASTPVLDGVLGMTDAELAC